MKFKFIYLFVLSILLATPCPKGELCYAEAGLPIIERLDPYNIIKKTKSYEKRYFALMHETLYERSNSDPLGNFIVTPEQSLIIHDYNENKNNPEYYVVLNMPDKIYDEKWEFHDGSYVDAVDLLYSIKYAIHKGVLNKEIFDLKRIRINDKGNGIREEWETFYDCDIVLIADEKIRLCEADDDGTPEPRWNKQTMGNNKWDEGEYFIDDKGNLEIGLKLKLGSKTLKSMLNKVYILPSNIFKDHIDALVKTGKRNKQIWMEVDEAYKKKPIAAGPYKYTKKEKRPLFISKRENYLPSPAFDEYVKKPKIKQFQIKYDALKGTHIKSLTDGDVNLIIDVPYPGNDYKKSTSKFQIKQYSNNTLNLFLINFSGEKEYLLDLEFRKAIAYAIGRKSAQKNKLENATLINSAATLTSSRYNPSIQGYSFSSKKMKKIRNKLNKNPKFRLKEEGRRRGRTLEYLHKDNKWRKIEFDIIYNYNDCSYEEEAALKILAKNLKKHLGVTATIVKVQRNNFKSRLRKPKKWDLAYDKIVIGEGESLDKYYASNGSVNKNGSRYKNDLVDQLIKEEKANLLQPLSSTQIGRQLLKVLSDDVASIFLWSIDSYCVYNKKELHSDNEMYINYDNFFTEPHNWKLVK